MSTPSPCRSPQEWEALLDRPLSAAEAEPLAQHLEACETCVDLVDAAFAGTTLATVLQLPACAEKTKAPSPLVQQLIDQLRAPHSIPGADDTAGFLSDDDAPIDPVRHADATQSLPIFSPPRDPGELGWVGHYRVLKQIGAGGMGLVFLADDSQLQRKVALKVMRPEMAASATHRERFVREARAVAAIEHDHIVPIYQVGEEQGVPFLAMKLLKGESLESYLQRGAQMPPLMAARLGQEVALGLAAAHECGLIHRDIKPANVWLEKEPAGRVKLLDFGLARGRDGVHITSPGIIVGTPTHMAPEQARGEDVDSRADLFSLGVLLYRLLTGRLPFLGKDPVSTLLAVTTETPEPVRLLNPSVPPALAELVMRLLEKDPAQRPASAGEVSQMLAAIVKGEAVAPAAQAATITEALPLPQPRRLVSAWKLRGPLWISLIATAAIMLVATGIIIRIKTPNGKVKSFEVPDGSKITIEPGDKPKPAKLVDELWIKEVAALAPEKQVETVTVKLKELNPHFSGRVGKIEDDEIEFTIKDGKVIGITVPTDNIADISPLRALSALREVYCHPADEWKGSGKLMDLRPLRGLSLEIVNVDGNRTLSDLTPLADMKLTTLRIYATKVANLEVVRAMPLWSLGCQNTPIKDLSPLAGKRMWSVYVNGTEVSDLSPLKGMKLREVGLKSIPATDLSVLADMPVEVLQFDYNPWRDADLIGKPTLHLINWKSPKEFRKEAAAQRAAFDQWCQNVAALGPEKQVEAVAAKLKELNPEFSGRVGKIEDDEIEFKVEDGKVTYLKVPTNHVADLSPVRPLPLLKILTCEPADSWRDSGRLINLWALRGLALTHLYCGGNPALADLSPLAGMKLEDLGLWRTAVADLKVVKDMPLTNLYCQQTPVKNLSPLAGKQMRNVDVNGCRVSDLTPLKGMKLVEVGIRDTPVRDLTVLADMPLESLQLDYNPRRDAELIRKRTLKKINLKAAEVFRKEVAGCDGGGI